MAAAVYLPVKPLWQKWIGGTNNGADVEGSGQDGITRLAQVPLSGSSAWGFDTARLKELVHLCGLNPNSLTEALKPGIFPTKGCCHLAGEITT